jgi:hypothetical protein
MKCRNILREQNYYCADNTMRRSIMQQPSVQSKVGKVSNPSDKQSDSTS